MLSASGFLVLFLYNTTIEVTFQNFPQPGQSPLWLLDRFQRPGHLSMCNITHHQVPIEEDDNALTGPFRVGPIGGETQADCDANPDIIRLDVVKEILRLAEDMSE
mmetsp:Transcript_31423/g.45978  ORF Transcript_31423/g.45978 Transcript_31423/m.45978 type:complete len:105 (-) Transcript_31423:83-397(-)